MSPRHAIATAALGLLACRDEPIVARQSVSANLIIEVKLEPSHPFFAEYHRSLTVYRGDQRTASAVLFPDTGGYSMVNVYRAASEGFRLLTMGNDSYVVNTEGDIRVVSDRQEMLFDVYLGAFDWCGSSWRFVSVAESPEMRVRDPHARRRRTCGNAGKLALAADERVRRFAPSSVRR